MYLKPLCTGAFATVAAAAVALVLTSNRQELDPDSGMPRLHSDELHFFLPPHGPWTAVRVDGGPAELICTNGTRVPLRRGSLYLATPADLRRKGYQEFPEADFPLYWHGDDVRQEIIRCRDGAVLWSAPGPE